MVWFNAEPLALGRSYLIKHAVRTTRAQGHEDRYRVEHEDAGPGAGARTEDERHRARWSLKLPAPLFFDPYERNRTTGSFILIDPLSNATVGAAMIRGASYQRKPPTAPDEAAAEEMEDAGDARARAASATGIEPALILVEGRPRLAAYLERALFAQEFEVLLVGRGRTSRGEHLETLLKFGRTAWALVVIFRRNRRLRPDDKRDGKQLLADRFLDLGEPDCRRRTPKRCAVGAGGDSRVARGPERERRSGSLLGDRKLEANDGIAGTTGGALQEQAEVWNSEQALSWGSARYGQSLAIASSFGAEDVVLIDVASRLGIAIPRVYAGHRFSVSGNLRVD